MKRYSGKAAVVTGAGGTLCSEIAVHLAREGACVMLCGRNEDKLLAVGEKINEFSGEYKIFTCDVTCEKEVEALKGETLKAYGKCDFLINGAGGNNQKAMTADVYYSESDERNFFKMDMEIFNKVLETNTMGSVIPARAFGKIMAENGGGNIINFASMNTYRPLTKVPAYAMSKAAIANFTQWLAAYLAPSNIRVNAIAPVFFINERSRQFLGSVEEGLTPRGEKVISHTPMGRFGEAKDLLGLVDFFLCENMSSFVTGVTIAVDGGFLSCPGI